MVWYAKHTINTHSRIEELKARVAEWNGNGEVPKRTQQIQYNYEKERKETNTRLLTIPNTRSRREEKVEKLRNTFRKYTKTYMKGRKQKHTHYTRTTATSTANCRNMNYEC